MTSFCLDNKKELEENALSLDGKQEEEAKKGESGGGVKTCNKRGNPEK